MNYLSVCAGIEAATVAWHPLGWTPIAFSEVDPFPCAVLAHHYPDVPNFGDMTKHKEWSLDSTVDLLVGGTPCQSFSVAGLRKGLDDPRGNLALVFLAIADRARPRWVVWENVPGVLSSNGGRDFGSFLGALAELGYGWSYRVLDAQYAGVPQRRRRVFVVGHLGDWRRAAAVLFERHSLSGDSPPRRAAREGVAIAAIKGAAIGRKPESGPQYGEVLIDGSVYTLNCTEQHAVAAPLGAHKSGRRNDLDNETYVAHTHRAEGFDASEDGTGRGTPLVPTTAPCLTQNYGKQPDNSDTSAGPMLVPVAFAENSRAELRLCGGDGQTSSQLTTGGGKPGQGMPCVAFDLRGRDGGSLPEGPHDTANLRAASGGSSRSYLAQPSAVRRLTPVECERLQGFHDDYTAVPYRGKPAADGPRYRALGNSMAVPVMRWLGERIAMVDAIETEAAA